MTDEPLNNDNKKVISIPLDSFYSASLILGLLGGSFLGYHRYLKQYKTVRDIPTHWFKRKWLYGKITAVGDGDNFHFYHLPGGALGGWGWIRPIPRLEPNVINMTNPAPRTSKKSKKSWSTANLFSNGFFFSTHKTRIKTRSSYYMRLTPQYKGKRNLPTISIRISGIDAPERAHFGNKAQPFSDEALNWLRYQVLGKKVWIKPLSIDQYNRCVARAVYWSWFGGWKDIGLQMIKEGLAVVYEGKTGAQFDGREKLYRLHEFIAKSQRKGLWIQKKVETPGQYKKKI